MERRNKKIRSLMSIEIGGIYEKKVDIYKEKNNNETRIIIIPFGRHKIGARQTYAIISYLTKKDSKK
ncbi:hypothetical protein [Fusobacterium varium]|uniref:hypothetical protein n=1 Tax=Fusobacterium varium TaxID=856 RepID=UPI0030D81417